MRDLTTSPSTRKAAEVAGLGDGPIEVAELSAQFSHQEGILTRALGLDGGTEINPSGGALAANPIMATGLVRIAEAAKQIRENGRHRVLAHATSGPLLQQNLVAILEGNAAVSAEPTAIVGIGQTKHKTRREDVSQAGLLREAAERALDDANMTWKDIDTVVIGKAPDAFEGVMMPELYLADALGAAGKPMMRVHTAGSVGGSTGIVASHLVSNRIHKRVLAVAYEKQSEGNAQWGLGGGKSGSMGAGGIFAPWIRAYIERSGAPEHIGWKVAVKDRLNALKNPYAHLQLHGHLDRQGARVADALGSAAFPGVLPVLRRRDGRRVHRRGGRQRGSAGRTPAGLDPVDRDAQRADAVPAARPGAPGRRACSARPTSTPAPGITNPREQIDVAELYVPFSWYEPMWLEGHDIAPIGEGWKMTDSGETEIGGAFPVNPSGGVLSSNPIGASGLIRFAEAALQVRGMAGEHQVDDAHVALAQAYGGGAQYFAMWVVADALDAVSRA